MKIPPIAPNRIGFDFDGVIADIGEAFLRLARERHNYSISLQQITSFHVETCTDIPAAIVESIFSDILNDSLATQLQPLPGAVDVLTELARCSRVKIITARSLDRPVTDWLEQYLPRETCRQIDLIAMKDHDEKVRYIKEHNLDFFVDDRAETCAQVAEADLHPLLYRQPWNSGWDNFTTVNNWQELAELIVLDKFVKTFN